MREVVWRSGEKPSKSLKSDREIASESVASNPVSAALGTVADSLRARDPPLSRDDVNAKLTARHMVGMTVSNPFFTDRTYLDDIAVETSYLRPRNTKE